MLKTSKQDKLMYGWRMLENRGYRKQWKNFGSARSSLAKIESDANVGAGPGAPTSLAGGMSFCCFSLADGARQRDEAGYGDLMSIPPPYRSAA